MARHPIPVHRCLSPSSNDQTCKNNSSVAHDDQERRGAMERKDDSGSRPAAATTSITTNLTIKRYILGWPYTYQHLK